MTVITAEGAVGIEQQAALKLARVACGLRLLGELLQVIARRGGQTELVADELVEYGASIAADGAMRFVRDDEVKVHGRELRLVFVVEEQ